MAGRKPWQPDQKTPNNAAVSWLTKIFGTSQLMALFREYAKKNGTDPMAKVRLPIEEEISGKPKKRK